MFLKLLFTDLPELFYTINLTPGILLKVIKFGPLTLSLTSGIFLIFISLIFFLIFYLKKLDEKKCQTILLGLIIMAWLPLYINFTYNNLYDLSENFKTLKFSDSSKRVLRLCNMDSRQNAGGVYCHLFSFFTFIKNNLPAGNEVQLLTSPGLDAYFNYYLYPNYKIVKKADYVLFYYPGGYIYKNNILYKKQDGKDLIIGEYKMLFIKNNAEFILKK
ncbi:MAG: hypothetical protein HYV53_04465 [Parcubacteria group bacterium]|nr:hypothetical protein [Parcubacteria group bacterium]